MVLPCPWAVVSSTTISRTKVQPFIPVILSTTILFRSGFGATVVSGLGGGAAAQSGWISKIRRDVGCHPQDHEVA
jgi:hypothetical protein